MTTQHADTARAMHAAEMRGQDMQEVCTLEIKHHGVGAYEVVRHDPVVTGAECQRRIDAAVVAERDAWLAAVKKYFDQNTMSQLASIENHHAAAIRARGQK